jgi:phosphopantetheinyl transferase
VREVLGGHLSIHPRNVSLQTDKLGKPRVCADRTLEISFSHAGDFGLIALSEIGSIGVDIEQESSDLDPTTIASQVFTADETRQVMEAGSTVSAREIFTGYWVQKEAILKMEGHGLLIDTRTVVAPIRARSVAIDEILTGEYVWMWRPLPGYLASLAILPAALSNLSQQLNT